MRRLWYRFCFRGNLSLVTSAATGGAFFNGLLGGVGFGVISILSVFRGAWHCVDQGRRRLMPQPPTEQNGKGQPDCSRASVRNTRLEVKAKAQATGERQHLNRAENEQTNADAPRRDL